MRTFYIFKINENFAYMYENNPYKIFNMIEELHHTGKYDMVLTYKYYIQIAIPFSKREVNNYIYNKYNDNDYYSKKNNTHILADNYEYSRLSISNTNLKLKSNTIYSSFFRDINNYSKNIFVCDFINKDYFWLNKIKEKDRQIDNILVK